MTHHLTPQQIDAFNKDGFLAIESPLGTRLMNANVPNYHYESRLF